MIFILKNADFSANNLGKIDLPFDLTDRHKAMLAQYSKNITFNQKMAFGAFINTLDNSGLMSKIKVLCMPILAANVGEAFVNLASSSYSKENDLSSSPNFDMVDDGVRNINTTASVSEALMLPSTKGLEFGNMHILCAANTEYYSELTETSRMMYLYQSSPEAIIQFSHTQGGGTRVSIYRITTTSFIDIFGENNFNVNCLYSGKKIYGLNSYNGEFYVITESEKSNIVNTQSGYESVLKNTVSSNARYNGNAKQTLASPHWVISIGTGLTDEEQNIYRTAINNLLSAFGK